MEIYNLETDIQTLCVTAMSFPEGIAGAFETLYKMLPSIERRKFYGISYQGQNGVIIYKAAVEEAYEGEARKCNCETFTIWKGRYMSERINNFMKDIPRIGKTFEALLKDPGIDANGYCLEMYLNNEDMLCMVKSDPSKT